MTSPYLCGMYTLTPTHCGTGQASAAVDLPIARESHTAFPELPASSLKGAWRALFQDGKSEAIQSIFGPSTDEANASQDGSQNRGLSVGQINFFSGQLLAFPVRALHECFVYVTCPLILERFRQMLHRFDCGSQWPVSGLLTISKSDQATAQATAMLSRPLPPEHQALVLEDVILSPSAAGQPKAVEAIASLWSSLLPSDDPSLKDNLIQNLVVIDNAVFQDLVRRTTPVQARVKLNDQKTTGSSSDASGNLWYEEVLPADCLFYQAIVPRHPSGEALHQFVNLTKEHRGRFQVGGNETVGQGLCAVELCAMQSLNKGGA